VTIRGLVFDFGGVIVNMRFDFARKLEEEYRLERATLVRTYYDSDEWRAIETGAGDAEAWRVEAHRRLEAVAGRELPLLHQQWRESWGPIDENLALIRALRPPYRIAILSNADLTLEERMRRTKLDLLFDDIVCSAVVGMAKPDARIYALAARRLALPTQDCLFIDDSERNVVAAREAGMAAVHFRVHEGDSLAEQLAEHGVVPGATL
jgi:putative hydrolase of the HAD superfamily